jgi:O-antigen ligase
MAASLTGVYSRLPLFALALQAAVLALALVVLLGHPRSLPGNRGLGWAALTLALSLAASTILSTDRAASLLALGQWVSYGLVAWLAATVIGREQGYPLARYLLLLGVLMTGLAVYFYWGEVGRTSLPVMNSIFGNKNHFAGYLLLLLPLALALYLGAERPRERLAYGAVAVFLGSAFLLTYSRGAWFAALPALLVVLWAFRGHLNRLLRRVPALLALTALVAFLIAQGRLGQTLNLGYQGALAVARATVGGEPQGTLAPRLDYWQGALRMVADYPLTGSGPGTFGTLFPSYQTDPNFYSRFAHNFFLQMGAEGGIPTLLASLALFGLLALGWARAWWREGRRGPAALLVGLAGGLVASTLHNLVELDWYIPAIGLLFALETGLLLGLAGGPRQAPLATAKGGPWRWVATAACVLLLAAVVSQWSAQYLLARAETAQTQQQAEGLLLAAAMLNPLDGEPHFRLADLYLTRFEQGGQPQALEQGIGYAQGATQRSPRKATYRVLLARLYLSGAAAGRPYLEKAVVELEGIVGSLQPLQVPYAYRELGRAYLRQGKAQAALALYQRLLAAFPQGPDTPQPPQPGALTRKEAADLLAEAHLALGNIYSNQRQPEQARQEYEASLALKPDSAPAHFNLGLIDYNKRRFAAALNHFQEAATLDPKHAPAFYFQGLSYLKLGQQDKAVASFRAALALDPGYEEARRALEGVR